MAQMLNFNKSFDYSFLVPKIKDLPNIITFWRNSFSSSVLT